MLAEKYLQRRYREGRKEGIEVGRKEGIEVGREEGIEEGLREGRKERDAERSAWKAWHERWQAAQSRGEPFNEPPPNRES